MEIEISKEFEFPEVNVKQGHDENMILVVATFPGSTETDSDKTVKFNVPNTFQRNKSHDDLKHIITDKLKTMSQTISFLDELIHKDTEEISLPEMITDAIGKSDF